MSTYFVAGAASAITQALLKKIAKGNKFFLVDRNEKHLLIIKNDLLTRGADKVQCFVQDLIKFEKLDQLIQQLSDFTDQLDVALITHGYLGEQDRAIRDQSEFLQIINTNFVSSALLSLKIVGAFPNRKIDTICFISSVAGDRGRKSNYIYGSAKGALSIFAQGLRNELYNAGIRVITVKPGFVDTPMTALFEKGLLWVKPDYIARDIIKAINNSHKDVIYSPWFWRYIMFIIRVIPESIFKKTSI